MRKPDGIDYIYAVVIGFLVSVVVGIIVVIVA
jgi:hypothetical protein